MALLADRSTARTADSTRRSRGVPREASTLQASPAPLASSSDSRCRCHDSSSSSAHPTAPGLAEMAPGSALRPPPLSLSLSLARSLRASTWVHPPSNHSSQPTTPTNNANASSPAETFLRRRSGRQSNQSLTVRQSGTVRGGQTARPSPGVPAVTPPPGTARCALAFSNLQPGITEGKPVEDR